MEAHRPSNDLANILKKDENMLTPTEKMAFLREQLLKTQSALQDTKKHVSALRVANGRSKVQLPNSENELSDNSDHDNDEDNFNHEDAHENKEGWL